MKLSIVGAGSLQYVDTIKGVIFTIFAGATAFISQIGISAEDWLQYGSLGVLCLYIILHWLERRDQRKNTEPILRELVNTLGNMRVLMEERLPHHIIHSEEPDASGPRAEQESS